ncbi:hypothetical protein BDQ17DRAFT_1333035 [Cyathus striatus]|nr:hypothetical protein BDQ17DRAFT_1333035 [Cyathus striatus]
MNLYVLSPRSGFKIPIGSPGPVGSGSERIPEQHISSLALRCLLYILLPHIHIHVSTRRSITSYSDILSSTSAISQPTSSLRTSVPTQDPPLRIPSDTQIALLPARSYTFHGIKGDYVFAGNVDSELEREGICAHILILANAEERYVLLTLGIGRFDGWDRGFYCSTRVMKGCFEADIAVKRVIPVPQPPANVNILSSKRMRHQIRQRLYLVIYRNTPILAPSCFFLYASSLESLRVGFSILLLVKFIKKM